MRDSKEYRPRWALSTTANRLWRLKCQSLSIVKGPSVKIQLVSFRVPSQDHSIKTADRQKHTLTYTHRKSQEEETEILPSHPGVHCGKTEKSKHLISSFYKKRAQKVNNKPLRKTTASDDTPEGRRWGSASVRKTSFRLGMLNGRESQVRRPFLVTLITIHNTVPIGHMCMHEPYNLM